MGMKQVSTQKKTTGPFEIIRINEYDICLEKVHLFHTFKLRISLLT